MRQKLIDLYLDFVNNYLTVAKFAEHNELDIKDANEILILGKKYHERYVEMIKK